MEAVFLLVFVQWYLSRYFLLGGQLPFGVMVAIILGLWAIILGVGLWRDKRSTPQSDSVDKRRTTALPGGDPVDKSRA
jgi:hypothetical protein